MIWKNTRRTKATKAWIENTDPIRLAIYHILLNVRFLVYVLVIYIFVLTISEGVFTLQNASDKAFGTNFVKKPYLTVKL